MKRIIVTQKETETVFENGLPATLIKLFLEFIKQEKQEEFLTLLPEFLGQPITGSNLCIIEAELKKAAKIIDNSHPDDAEVQIAEILEQAILIFN